jgi:uncharacterized coiled-coil DUF342 family protein
MSKQPPTERIEELRTELKGLAKEQLTDLQKQRERHIKKHTHLHERREKLLAKQQELQKEINEVVAQIQAEEHPELTRIDTEISQLAKESGGRFLSDTP